MGMKCLRFTCKIDSRRLLWLVKMKQIYHILAILAYLMFACKSSKVERTQTSEANNHSIETVVFECCYTDDDEIYFFADMEEPPLFNGKPSEIGFQEYLHMNCTWYDIKGRIFGEFIVEKDGSVCNVKLLRNIYPPAGADVLRVVNASPKWTPGKVNGEPVRVRQQFYVSYDLR